MANHYPEELNTHKKDWANTTPVKDTHPEEHNDIAGAVEALEAKVGIDGSEDHDSHDYKLSGITDDDKAASDAEVAEHIADTSNPHAVTKGQVGLGNVDNTSDATKNAAEAVLENKTIDADDNDISNLELDNFKANVVDTDVTLAANSDSRLPTQKAVKKYVEDHSGGGVNVIQYDYTGSSQTWTKQDGLKGIHVQMWAGGGSGGRNGGGGGGAFWEFWVDASGLGGTEAVVIGAGGASVSGNNNGNNGGTTSFKGMSVYGGGGGTYSSGFGGGGGGIVSAGSGSTPGGPTETVGYFGGGAAGNGGGSASVYGGGGGAGDDYRVSGGSSVFGGGGGVGQQVGGSAAPGSSSFGGAGGATLGAAGATPAGGGAAGNGGASGMGGHGRVIVTEFY